MVTGHFGRLFLARAAILTVFVALLVMTAPHQAEANQRDDWQSQYGDIFDAMCEAAGGRAMWEEQIGSTGIVTLMMTCKGGYLDGLLCLFDERFTRCVTSRYDGGGSSPTVEPEGIEPFDEPVFEPVGSAEEPDTVAPIEQETPDSPTPEGGDDLGLDPAATEPVVDSGDVAPEQTATPGAGDGSEIVEDGGIVIYDAIAPELLAEPIEEPVVDDGRYDGARDVAPAEIVILT